MSQEAGRSRGEPVQDRFAVDALRHEDLVGAVALPDADDPPGSWPSMTQVSTCSGSDGK